MCTVGRPEVLEVVRRSVGLKGRVCISAAAVQHSLRFSVKSCYTVF